MAYDEKKDKELAGFDIGELRVTVNSYDGKEAKVGMSRAYVKDGETRFGRAGRLTKEEFEDLTNPKLVKKILAAIEKGA